MACTRKNEGRKRTERKGRAGGAGTIIKAGGETRLRLEEDAAAKAKAEAISGSEPEKREEAELEAHKGDGKQDGQLEDGRDVDTETSSKPTPPPLLSTPLRPTNDDRVDWI